jgi:antitoxin VapB
MALSIKNRELEEVSRELARITGKPITEALLVGARRELERQRKLRTVPTDDESWNETWAFIQQIQREYAALPELGPKLTDDEILGYDEFGIPSK